MTLAHGRTLACWLSMGLAGLLLSACRKPETVLRERPVQRVELVQTVRGMTPQEDQDFVAEVAAGLGLAETFQPLPGGPTRVLRIELTGGPSSQVGRGFGMTLLISTGTGALVGALLPCFAWTYWQTLRSAAIATAAGGLLGLAYAPTWYQDHQRQLRELGYLPWGFRATWTVLERQPDRTENILARSESYYWNSGTPSPSLRSHLRPLPAETRTPADIRQASLSAYAKALVQHFREK